MKPNPNDKIPNPNFPGLCYVKNVVKNPNVIVGDFTYYYDDENAENFEDHITNFYMNSGRKPIDLQSMG